MESPFFEENMELYDNEISILRLISWILSTDEMHDSTQSCKTNKGAEKAYPSIYM